MGCSTQALKGSETLEDHAIIVDKAGKPYIPTETSLCVEATNALCDDERHWTTQDGETYLTNAYDEYLSKLIDSAKNHFEHNKNKIPDSKKRLLIFVHGGLNKLEDSNVRTLKLAKQIMEDTNDKYYPIFVNWDSDFLSSYGEHLTSVRQGKRDRWAWATSPTYLATDLGRALIRAPVVWWSQVGNDLTSWPSNKDNWFFDYFDLARGERDANTIGKGLTKDLSENNFKFWLGQEAPSTLWKDTILGTFRTALTYPSKILFSPFIDALGKSAWENMLRRTDLLFHTENEFQTDPAKSKEIREATIFSKKDSTNSYEFYLAPQNMNQACQRIIEQGQGLHNVKAGGALSVFLRKFIEAIRSEYHTWSITLVGHSMGAIIVNHIIRDFGDCLPIENIVFMASASTFKDYEAGLFPYMLMRKANETKYRIPMPQVYNLMLHELAETRETNFWDLSPTGSLLVWIDNFLSTPLTPMDRTSGRFTNFMLALHTIPKEIRSSITMKRFPGGGSGLGETRDGIPTRHDDFVFHFKFWLEDCWKAPKGKDDTARFQEERNKNCFY